MLVGVVALMGLGQSAAVAPVAAVGWTLDGDGVCKIVRRYRSEGAEFELRLWRTMTQGSQGILEYRPIAPAGNQAAVANPAAAVPTPPRSGSLTLTPTGFRLPLTFLPNGSSATVTLMANQYAVLFGAHSAVIDDGVAKVTATLGLAQENMRALDICRDEKLKKWGVDDGQLEAIPAVAVARWFIGDPYPAPAKRAGAQGVTTAVLAADERGVFVSCLVVGSSGNADLDAATCRVAVANGSLDPAAGRARRYRILSVRWVLADS